MGNLPQPRTRFIGRQDEIVLARQLLAGNRLVTLTGAGGTGKTRLALAVATTLADTHADDAWFVSCAAISDPALVLPTIIQSLGLQVAGSQPPLAILISHLAERHSLLVLDNLEQVIDVAPEIGLLLDATSRLTILVTSRIPLHLDGEQLLPVPPLGLIVDTPSSLERIEQSSAVALFVQRCQMVKPDFQLTAETAPVILDICRQLDGPPLAIELAAARVRLLSPQALVERLERRLPLLIGGPRDVPARQQTLRATIAWSYDLLQPEEQMLLRRLSNLKGGWTLEAAEALVANADAGADVFHGMATLIEHSLIQAHSSVDGSARFAMLETIREYGLEQLDAAGEVHEVHRRHVNHQLHVFSSAERDWHTPRAEVWLQRGDAEIENVRLALEWAITNDPEMGLRLGHAFSWIWSMRGAVPESQRWLAQGLERAGDVPDDLRADTLWWMGANATTLGEYAQARAAHEEALAIYADRGNDIGVANCLHGLGRIEQFTGNPGQAVVRYEAAADLLRQHHAPRLMVTLSNLGIALLESDKLDRASAVLDEALVLAERDGLPWHRAQVLGGQASLALARGDLPGARRILRRCVQFNRDAADPRFVAQTLETCAWLATAEGAMAHAALLLGAAGRLRETIGVPVSPSARRKYDRNVPVIQSQLSPSDWQRAWAEGHSLSLAEAIEVALTGVTEVSTPSSAPADRHGGLSVREIDVLRLIVEGKSDREIAADLFISHHTVMRHVSNILGKIGVESRTAAATYAIRHNLH